MGQIIVRCPNSDCRSRFRVDAASVGRRARCRKCGMEFVIGAASSTAVTKDPPPVLEAVSDGQGGQAPRPEAGEGSAGTSGQDRPAAVAAPEDSVPDVWQVGETILNLYEVRQVHTGGGMGLVYRVHHRDWGIDLAVKSPRPDERGGERQKQDFERECETWVNLGLHPHIVSCYYVRRLGGIPRVFAEYVEGGSLSEWIRDGRLYEGGHEEALKRILDIAIQFAWGLRCAHDRHLVHQDVKPLNVMMTPEAVAKVTDFGLARARAAMAGEAAEASTDASVSHAGFMTREYCSPEQARKQELTPATDIWSWGVSVLEMFVGRRTWRSGTTAASSLAALLDVGPAEPSAPPMPGDVRELLARCFRPDPPDRPGDFGQVADALVAAYRRAVGRDYPRDRAEAAELLAGGLNNRALSMLDLGRAEEAESLFDRAYQADPNHPETVYNRGLMLWRAGRLTDEALLAHVWEATRGRTERWQREYCCGLIHVERGDADSAVEDLESALEDSGDDADVRADLETARAGAGEWSRRLAVLEGHTDKLTCLAMSADGGVALSASEDGTLRVWDAASARCLHVLAGSPNAPVCAALSADGRTAASGSWLGPEKQSQAELRIWETATGRCVRTIEPRGDFTTSVALGPEGRVALSCTFDAVQLWDARTGECLWQYDTGEEPLTMQHPLADLSEDGRAAVISAYGPLFVYDLASKRRIGAFEEDGHEGWVQSVDLSADGRLALSSATDGAVCLWDVPGRCLLRKLTGHTFPDVKAILSPDGRRVLSEDRGKARRRGTGSSTKSFVQKLRLWDVASGKCIRTLEQPDPRLRDHLLGAFSHDGAKLLLPGEGHAAELWRHGAGPAQPPRFSRPLATAVAADRQREVRRLAEKARGALASGQAAAAWAAACDAQAVPGYSAAADLLALRRRAGARGRLSGLYLARSHRRIDAGGHGRVQQLAISPDGALAVAAAGGNALRLWDLRAGRCQAVMTGPRMPIWALGFTPDGRFVLSTTESMHETLRCWDVQTARCVRMSGSGDSSSVMPAHTTQAVSGDGRRVLAASWMQHGAVLWDFESGRGLRLLREGDDAPLVIALSADARVALTACKKAVHVWDVPSAARRHTLETKSDVSALAISEDNRFALTGGGEISLWDLKTGRCVTQVDENMRGVRCVALLPGGRFALSHGLSGYVALYDLRGEHRVRVLGEDVQAAASSPDGRWLLLACSDQTLRMYELHWDYEFPDPADWDDRAGGHLESFLVQQCPYGQDGCTRVGPPKWSEADFERLMGRLGLHGYGCLRPEGVRARLEELTAGWRQWLPEGAGGDLLPDTEQCLWEKDDSFRREVTAGARRARLAMTEPLPDSTKDESLDEMTRRYEHLVNEEGRRDLAPSLAQCYAHKALELALDDQHAEACGHFGAAIELRRRDGGAEDDPDAADDLSRWYRRQAKAATALGDHEAALAPYSEAVALLDTMVRRQKRTERADELAAGYRDRARCLARLDRHSEAVDDYTRAAEILEPIVFEQGRRELEEDLEGCYVARVGELEAMGGASLALESMDRVIAIYRRLVEEHGQKDRAVNLAKWHGAKGEALQRLKGHAQAVNAFNEAIGLYEYVVRELGLKDLLGDLGTCHMNKGIAISDAGDRRAAIAAYAPAIEIFEYLVNQQGQQEHANILAKSYLNTGADLAGIGDHRAAVSFYDRAVEIRERLVNEQGREDLRADLARLRASRAFVLLSAGEPERARAEAREAEAMLRAEAAATGRVDLAAMRRWLVANVLDAEPTGEGTSR